MLRHQLSGWTWPEWLGGVFMIALGPGFWFLITRFLFQDPDFLLESLRELEVAGLNRISLNLVLTGFLVVVLVGIIEEVCELFRTPESPFLLSFPFPPSAYLSWRMLVGTVRILMTMTLFMPLLIVYLFYFQAKVGGFGLAGMVVLLAVAILGSAVFLAAVTQLGAALAARLLASFRQNHLVLLGLAIWGSAAWYTLEPLWRAAREGGIGLAMLAAAASNSAADTATGWSGLAAWFPLNRFLSSLEVVDHGHLTVMMIDLTVGLVGLAIAVAFSGLVMKTLVLIDQGVLRERAQFLQTNTGSIPQFWPLNHFSPVNRGIVHEELVYLFRKWGLGFWLVLVPTLIFPLLVPRFVLELFPVEPLAMFAGHGAILMILLIDLVASDFTDKPSFLAVVGAQPVPLSRFLLIKATGYGSGVCLLLAATFIIWSQAVGFPSGTILPVLGACCIWSISFVLLGLGMRAGTTALFWNKITSCGSSGKSPVANFFTVITVMGMLGSVAGPLAHRMIWLSELSLVVWFPVSLLVFRFGTTSLEARILEG
jgi:hypothetical protein